MHILVDLVLRLLLLEVGLAVQVFSLNVADTLWKRALKQDQISRESRIFFHLDNASNLKLQASHGLKCLGTALCSRHLHHVFGRVLRPPLSVLKYVLDHGDSDDKDERQRAKNGSIGRPNVRNDLQEHTEEEIRVGHLGKLDEQVLGQEVKACILCSGHFIVHEIATWFILLENLIDLKKAPFFGLASIGVAGVRFLIACTAQLIRPLAVLDG